MNSEMTKTMMQVSKWGKSLAVRLPKEQVETLGITEGDNVSVTCCYLEKRWQTRFHP
jgi:antitoxin MazE